MAQITGLKVGIWEKPQSFKVYLLKGPGREKQLSTVC